MDHSQPASMQDVAKAASVSPQTVSRVANGSNAVRPETRQRVEAAMAKLGYRPNYAARALKHGKFKDVGVVLFNMLTYGNARILGGIADAANSNGYAITMQSFGRNRERTLHAAIERMKQLPVDGVIAVMEEHVTDFSEFRPPKELPVVIKGDVQGSVEAIVAALDDDVRGTELAGQPLPRLVAAHRDDPLRAHVLGGQHGE